MPSEPTTCAVHFEEKSEASCRSCGRTMCRECWARDVDDDPCCEACIALLERPTPMVLYVVGALLAFGAIVAGSLSLTVRFELPEEALWAALGVGALSVVVTAHRLHGRAESSRAAHRIRPRSEAAPRAHPQSPYRGRLRRLARVVAPPLSGQMTVLVTVMLMTLVAAAVPRLLTLPRWVEWELVMGGWWAVWAAVFAVLLFRGWRIADDVPDLRRGGSGPSGLRRAGSLLEGIGSIGPDGCVDAEGCAIALIFLLALAASLAVAWVVVELLLPIVIGAAYWLIARGLTRVANDHHDCEGRLVRSLGWASLWALIYTAPLAVVIAIGQAILAAR